MKSLTRLIAAQDAENQRRMAIITASRGRIAEAEALAEALSSLGAAACAMQFENEVIVWVNVDGATAEEIKAAIAAADLKIAATTREPGIPGNNDRITLRLTGLETEIWGGPKHHTTHQRQPLALAA